MYCLLCAARLLSVLQAALLAYTRHLAQQLQGQGVRAAAVDTGVLAASTATYTVGVPQTLFSANASGLSNDL